jgi:carbonic anhydrase
MNDKPWLETMLEHNTAFQARVNPDKLPVQRTPGKHAIITCMDPRVNLEAFGIPSFGENGEGASSVRIIRTIGAIPEPRSLIIGLFLAGIREIAIVMHTDCGCCLAFLKIDGIIQNMQNALTEQKWQTFKEEIGEPFRERLIKYLHAFEDPRAALKREIQRLKQQSFIPSDLVIHGLLYELAAGRLEVIENGYK